MTSATPKPRAGEHVLTPQTDAEGVRFGRIAINWRDGGQTVTELVPADFARNLEAERDDLAKALEVCDKAIRGVIGDGPVRGNGTPYPVWADMISAAVQARALLAKHGR